ncbi:MAG: hemerythrin domain-containing protein [Proteobacteria bacterium]|nr:hemerythrin domain-containing protein [Pseudomonadota bacterium]
MASIVGSLHQDHINSTKLLDVLEQQLVIFSRAEVPDYEMMQGVMEYFLDYPDLYHHPTEDLILSKVKTQGWTAKDGFPDLRHEHQELASMTRGFSTAIQDILQEVEMPREAFQRRAREFLDFYRSHIRKEEEIFYPAALKVLTKEDWAEISEAREIRDDPIFGPKSHERLETLREGILAWSGATGT